MASDFLHNHRQFPDLIRIVAEDQAIEPGLVEKDYWIMHCLFGLQSQGFNFELKGGTSLSKGFRIIDRFSEDIDIQINPPEGVKLPTGRNQNKPAHISARMAYFDGLAAGIGIDGVRPSRDREFDNETLHSAGIRLRYQPVSGAVEGLKEGVLLEAGFDTVTPNQPCDISSWAYDFAATRIPLIDNRALGVRCYDPGHTLVEKLQTISTKFRKQQESGGFPTNFMRHYYDVYRLLQQPAVQAFVGGDAYRAHKSKRFRQGDEPDLTKNEAFLLRDAAVRRTYTESFQRTSALYYRNRPTFEAIVSELGNWVGRL